MKPALFNTDMVRAILEDRKTVTRRVVKDPYYIDDEEASRVSGLAIHRGTNMTDGMPYPDQPYCPGDILYVRETFSEELGKYVYKADGAKLHDGMCWHPSIHMPLGAARIFLRVKDVRVERLQDITVESAKKEGAFHSCSMCIHWHDYCGQAVTMARDCKIDQISPEFQLVWDSTLKPKDRALYGWEANPWVWVIEFKRCEKPEGGT